MVPHIHGDFCFFLTNPTFGRFRQGTMPRAFFKTWVGTVGGSIWLTLPDEEEIFKSIYPYKGPNCRVLIASNVIDNAAKMVHKIKDEWMRNTRLQAAFPELVPDFNKARWSDHAAELKRELRATEATYTAVGVGGSVISQHFDHIIEDDLIYAKKDDFTGMELMPSQEDIDNAIGWHKLTFSLFSHPKESCLWNIGTRWAPQDLVAYIRKHEKHYTCFEIDAEDDGTGQVAWPERYPLEELEKIKAAQGARIYETQYRNRPRSMDDVVFDVKNVQVHDSLDEFPKNLTYYTVVDLAGWGDSRGTARNAVVTAARDDKNHIWVARVDAGRYNPSEVIAVYKDHSRRFHSKIYIEEVQYQASVRFWSKREMEETGEMFTQNRLPRESFKDAKKLRIVALEPFVSNGALHVLANQKSLLEELELYPHSKTVDILDCLGYLRKILPISRPEEPKKTTDKFSVANVIDEILKRKNSAAGYPFDLQVAGYRRGLYERN